MKSLPIFLSGEDDEEEIDHSAALSSDEAVAVLEAALGAYTTQHEFRRGDLITMKDGLAALSKTGERGKHPAIFVRYEEWDGEFDDRYDKYMPGTTWPLCRSNALAMWIHTDGGVVVSAIHSDLYEPWEPKP